MNIYTKKKLWKYLLLAIAVFIGGTSLWYTNNIVSKLAIEEQKKVELVATATKIVTSTTDFTTDLNFSFKVIQDNNTVPVILTNANHEVISWRNLDSTKVVRDPAYISFILKEMSNYHAPIKIEVSENTVQYIYFKPSVLIDLLKFYPYVQLSIIAIFIIIAYLAFSSSRNAEQNQVWVGMSKETAHQLGTPLSSLSGWLEILKSQGIEESISSEIEKDLVRLNSITNRFSKIGSPPVLQEENLHEVLNTTINYLRGRLSKKLDFTFDFMLSKDTKLLINQDLIAWVIENLCKNSVDAMGGVGSLRVLVNNGKSGQIYIDVIDSGKGIPKSEFTKVFKPGFTTKKRGWGLGLSLVKRIVEQYHFGKVFVKSSNSEEGTSIRISLNPDDIRKRI
ncbi:MAG: signal transduction histidine kinase [Glaciecola sp.]